MIHESLGEDLERTEEGWYIFPRDVSERQQLFPAGVGGHPAKMHMEIVKRITGLYSEPGDFVLDMFAGTGTTALALLQGRKVILIELEKTYLDFLEQLKQIPWAKDVVIMPGDARRVMTSLIPPNSIQLIITSPPYPHFSLQAKEGVIAERAASMGVSTYMGGAMNFSQIKNDFVFNIEMRKIYKAALDVLKPGGFYVTVTKDGMEKGKRNLLSHNVVKASTECGFEYTGDWFKWKTPRAFGNTLNAAAGRDIVEDEDIIVMRKPA